MLELPDPFLHIAKQEELAPTMIEIQFKTLQRDFEEVRLKKILTYPYVPPNSVASAYAQDQHPATCVAM